MIWLSWKYNVSFGKKCVIGWKSGFEGNNKISDGVVFGDSRIGFGSYIGEGSRFAYTVIGRYTSIAPGVETIFGSHPTSTFVSTHPCFFSLLKQSGFTYVDRQLFEETKFIDKANRISIRIGNDVWIGANVKIMAGVNIGDGAIIAAGAIVTKDAEPYGIYGGVPAKTIRYRFGKEDIEYLLETKWWDKGEDWIKANARVFHDIEAFKKALKQGL